MRDICNGGSPVMMRWGEPKIPYGSSEVVILDVRGIQHHRGLGVGGC